MTAEARTRLITAALAIVTVVMVAAATVRLVGGDGTTSAEAEEVAASAPAGGDGGDGTAVAPADEATGQTVPYRTVTLEGSPEPEGAETGGATPEGAGAEGAASGGAGTVVAPGGDGVAPAGPRLPITSAEAAAVRSAPASTTTIEAKPATSLPSTAPVSATTVPSTALPRSTTLPLFTTLRPPVNPRPPVTLRPPTTVASSSTVPASATSSAPRSTVTLPAPTSIAPSTTVPTTTAPSTAAPTTPPPSPPAGGMSAVEWEIVRLTNELRTNPTGPEARKKGQPSCVAADGAGRPLPVPALSVSEAVSIQLARDWSIAMDRAGAMSHRPGSEQQAIYSRLGISVRTWGENVAWFSGYSDAQAARVLFEGWRESDGHYCNMMSEAFTHFGVGVHKGSRNTWSTQNFYATR